MNDTQENSGGRRPLKVRNAGMAKSIAAWLSHKNITPNQISIASVLFAVLAAVCFFLLPFFEFQNLSKFLIFFLAAIFIQLRLLCNLFDGMVAVEGGKSTASGELFNDIPDRLADPIILVSVGYATTSLSWATSLAWLAALLAILTAYIRTLSTSIGAPVNFQGPMAKQHRMALITLAAIIAAFESKFFGHDFTLPIALAIVVIGCMITATRRTISAYRFLENKNNV